MPNRGWTFIHFNPTNQVCEHLASLQMEGELVYIAFALEHAPSTGTPHLQGFLYCDHSLTMKELCKMMPGSSFKQMKGTAEDNKKYCSKEGQLVEFGDVPRSGARTDIHSYVEEIKTSESMVDFLSLTF